MFVRRFMESSNVRGTCIVTMNLLHERALLRCSLSPRESVGVRGKGVSACPPLPTKSVVSSNPRFMERGPQDRLAQTALAKAPTFRSYAAALLKKQRQKILSVIILPSAATNQIKVRD
jgi:hypothetical protein